jgi:hypothetical protein
MQLLIRRLLKINPVSARLSAPFSEDASKKRFPFELFKLLMSNMNIYFENRQKRQQLGKELVPEDLQDEKIIEWMIKCLLTYARDIENNEELDLIVRYLNSWNVDILALIKTKFLDPKINLPKLCLNYFSV